MKFMPLSFNKVYIRVWAVLDLRKCYTTQQYALSALSAETHTNSMPPSVGSESNEEIKGKLRIEEQSSTSTGTTWSDFGAKLTNNTMKEEDYRKLSELTSQAQLRRRTLQVWAF